MKDLKDGQTPVIIAKFGNRKYYAYFLSEYLNSQQLFKLILEGKRVQVIERGKDRTREILMGLLAARRHGDMATLPLESLYEELGRVGAGPMLFFGKTSLSPTPQEHASVGAPQAVVRLREV